MRSAPASDASDASDWRNTLRRYDALVFFLMILALTWVVWIPRAMGFPVGVVGRLWTWIPAITALVCAALLYGRPGVGDLGRDLCGGGFGGGGIRLSWLGPWSSR
jgi:uncharacterized membrane protein YgcG